MATLDIAAELRARLRSRRNALAALGRVYQTSRTQCAWWRTGTEPVDCIWVHGSAIHPLNDDERHEVRFRDFAEELALLGALERINPNAFLDHVREVWNVRERTQELPVSSSPESPSKMPSLTPRRVLGFSYRIHERGDFNPISERAVGVDRPSRAFLRDYEWLEAALRSAGHAGVGECGPISVRICMSLISRDPEDLAFLLRDILKDVITQQLYDQSSVRPNEGGAAWAAAASTRFRIVEVSLDEEAGITANVETIECLARLYKFGVQIGRLPPLHDQNLSLELEMSLTESICTLIPTEYVSATPTPVQWIYADCSSTASLVPALFSALQSSTNVKHIELNVNPRPFDEDRGQSFESAVMLWKWTAYALFSAHAEHAVESLTLHVDYLDDSALSTIEEVLHAEYPLGVLFEWEVERDQWISASRFFLHEARDDTHKESLYVTQAAVHVRVIERFIGEMMSEWWQVLLPGYGIAWVAAQDAMEIVLPKQRQPVRPLHLQVEGFTEAKREPFLAFLQLVPAYINSIEIETITVIRDAFDMTDWTQAVLRLLPNLERLKYPWNAEIEDLNVFVGAAEAGHCHLRSLSSNQTFYPDTAIAFLDVLCDASHPLTRQLEEIDITVSIDERSTKGFHAAWRRLLDHNRTLHTIFLFLWADVSVAVDEKDVAIRTGPLCNSIKLAFLSTVQDRTSGGSARSRLDTGVLGTVFSFAAPHRIRKINIQCESA